VRGFIEIFSLVNVRLTNTGVAQLVDDMIAKSCCWRIVYLRRRWPVILHRFGKVNSELACADVQVGESLPGMACAFSQVPD